MISAILLACALAAVSGAVVRWVLARIPEPAVPAGKPPYRLLADRPMLAACTAISGLSGLLLGLRLPWQLWPVWVGWLSLGLVLVAVDARTTWLPLSLTRPLWAVTALGTVVTAALHDWRTGLTMVLAAAAVGAFFALFWRLRPGALGFGDVRLAPVIGAVCGSVSVSAVFVGLLAGTLLGALLGVVLHLCGRRREFPYGPALWLGTVVVLLPLPV